MVTVTGLPLKKRVVKSGVKIDGKIVRSDKWKEERIVFLKSKINDFKVRTENALKQIKVLEAELAVSPKK